MVETLRELNDICQKPNHKTVGNWMVRKILRPAALPATWLLLHTNVTANQVTFVSLIVGLIGTFLFALLPLKSFLAGTLFLQLWYYLDHVDGQIARYRNTASLSGRFYDFLVHHLIHPACFFSLGLYVFNRTGFVLVIPLAFISAMGIMIFNVINDIKSKAFVERLLQHRSIGVLHEEKPSSILPQSHIQRIFSLLHKSAEIHVVLNTLTAASFIQFVLWPLDVRILLFIFYVLLTPFLAITKISYLILRNKIDEDFIKHFQVYE